MTLLPLYYGRSLNPAYMSQDPFYALNELFTFYAASELQFLNVVESGLRSSAAVSGGGIPSKLSDIQDDLVFYKKLLERHRSQISETLSLISNRHVSDWPRSQFNKPQLIGVRLEQDFQYLLNQVKLLQERSESTMSVLMNHASLEQARRAVTEGERIYRLSLLVSFFIPLSFCATIFSMSFVQFSTLGRGLGAYLAVTLPVFGVSCLLFF